MTPKPHAIDVETRVWTLLDPVIAAAGFELVEVEYAGGQSGPVLRLYIDHTERAVTIEDTTEVTHLVDPVLDLEDPIETKYTLEVSSPGLDRPLRKESHFERFSGEVVKIKTRHPVGEAPGRKNFKGTLKGIANGFVTVEVDGTLYEVPHEDIARANVVYRFEQETGR